MFMPGTVTKARAAHPDAARMGVTVPGMKPSKKTVLVPALLFAALVTAEIGLVAAGAAAVNADV